MYLKPEINQELVAFFAKSNILAENESIITVEIPGAGNMNLVIRIITNLRSIILKQAKPWVEKYPSIAAPVDRSYVEGQFYQKIACYPDLAKFMPKLLGVYSDENILIFEDLGECQDFQKMYMQPNLFTKNALILLLEYLTNLHQIEIDSFPANDKLKSLNHFHIFDFPFQIDNGFDLDTITPGLNSLKKELGFDEIKDKIHALGQQYLGTNTCLIHGDFYPGSWMNTSPIKIIDPEFAFLSFAEFDYAILKAHLLLSKNEELVPFLETNLPSSLNLQLIDAWAGIEVLRRIYGVAQLPLCMSISDKKRLSVQAIKMIKKYA